MKTLSHIAAGAPFAFALLAGCSFNVSNADGTAQAITDGAPYASVQVAQTAGIDPGRIEIHGGSVAEVHASADVSMLVAGNGRSNAAANSFGITFGTSGTAVVPALTMTATQSEDPPRLNAFVIDVPSRYAVDVTADSASALVDGIAGDVHVVLNDGSANVATLGSATLTTDSGSISARVGGSLNAHAASGSIAATAVGGSLHADSGSVDVAWAGTTLVPLDVLVNSGSIHVRVAASTGFHLQAQTSSGGISTNGLGLDSNTTVNSGIDVDVHGGGPLLSLRTDSGSITVEVE